MIWNEWGRITRFHESARLALVREQRLWNELQLDNAEDATIRVENGDRTYQATVAQHRRAVSDEQLLSASVLIYSYALAEAAAEDLLGPGTTASSGIEYWGESLLMRAGNSWHTVEGGKAGVVEVAIVRNAVAHGYSTYSASSVARLAQIGHTPNWQAGDLLRLDYDSTLQYRAWLKSLLRNGRV